jgi:hypothetical protein
MEVSCMAARESSSKAVVSLAGPLRDEAATAAERAVRRALEKGLEPAPLAGVEIDELKAMMRRVVADELRLVQEASSSSGGSPVSSLRDRMRRRRPGKATNLEVHWAELSQEGEANKFHLTMQLLLTTKMEYKLPYVHR